MKGGLNIIFAEELTPEEREQKAAEIFAEISGKKPKELRAYRREHGLCTICGYPNDTANRAACSACRARQSEYDKAHRMKNNPVHKRRTSCALSIAQVCRMAAERHVSYGEMVMILEGRSKA